MKTKNIDKTVKTSGGTSHKKSTSDEIVTVLTCQQQRLSRYVDFARTGATK